MASSDASPSPPAPRRWARRLFIASQLLLGLGLGLAITEYVFAQRDEHAFPHVNFYVPDAELGVRLEPGATMKFRLRENPLTSIHVNAQGYRGADWPAPTPDAPPGRGEIVVLGDSQVFGLGVEDDETFSARLAAASGRTVINAGVPTYGPPEYALLARELLEQRKPETLIVTLNFLNDPFELERPNVDRHEVWDGWAVRVEHAPAEQRAFPGRKWLYSQSHAFYALRRWLHERDKAELPEAGESVDFGTPTEGGFEDLVANSVAAHAERERERELTEQTRGQAKARLGSIAGELDDKRDALDSLVREASEYEFDYIDSEIARGRPGDIVEEDHAEESRSVVLTAALIRQAARERERYVTKLLREQEKRGKTEVQALLDAERDLAAERTRLRTELANPPPPPEPPASVFEPWLRELAGLCEAHGTELIVIALPVDVQVDAREWDKYGVDERPDMSESLILLSDLVANAERLGVRALDATAALRAASPGAFLDHDIHMTPQGHAALAQALVERLATPLPVVLPRAGLPEGRSFAPAYDEWSPSDEVAIAGSTKAGCTTQIEREWLKVVCGRRKARDEFAGVELLEGGAPASMLLHTRDGLSLVTPLTIGTNLTARFAWGKQIRELHIRWPLDAEGKPKFSGSFVDVEGTPTPSEPSVAAVELCSDHEAATRETWCEEQGSEANGYYASDCRRACTQLFADPRLHDACTAAFASDFRLQLACTQHDPLAAPPCPPGSVHAFASNACFVACDAAHPCPSGTCTDWQGGGVCL